MLGPHVGLDPQRNDFALSLPTCWYIKSLVPNASANQPNERANASQWNIV